MSKMDQSKMHPKFHQNSQDQARQLYSFTLDLILQTTSQIIFIFFKTLKPNQS